MNYFFCVTVILGIALFYREFFNRKFAETIPVSVCSVALLLYVFTFILPLNVSAAVVSGLGVCGLAYAAFKEGRRIRSDGLKIQNYKSYPFILFVISCVMIYIMTRGRMAIEWDEFSHWMLSAKNMYIFKNFGIGEHTTVMFTDYPPATGLFNTFFTIFSPEFQEDYVYMGMCVAIIAFLFVPLKNTELFWKSLLVFGTAVLVPLRVSVVIYRVLYVDDILGIVFAYLLYVYFSERRFDYFWAISVVAGSAFLVLIKKATGVGLFAAVIIIIFSDIIFFNRRSLCHFNGKRRWAYLALIPIIPLIFKYSWTLYVSNSLARDWDASGITMNEILELFTGNIPHYRAVAIHNFIDAFLNVGIHSKVPFIVIPILLATAMLFVMLFVGRWSGEWRRWLTLNLLLTAAFYLYAASLLVLYLFIYSETEAQMLASLARYMNTIKLGIALFDVFIVLGPSAVSLNTAEPQKRYIIREKLLCGLAFSCVFIVTFGRVNSEFLHCRTNIESVRAERSAYALPQDFCDALDYKTDRVYYIGLYNFDYLVEHLNLTPVSIELNSVGVWANNSVEGDLATAQSTADEWAQELIAGGYTYVHVTNSSDQFKKEFGTLFEGPDKAAEGIYKVIIADNKKSVRLIPI